MKEIKMTVIRLSSDGWKETETETFYRVSRWIRVRQNYNPSKSNNLYDYASDEYGYKPYQDEFNPANGLTLDYFKWNGRNYAIEQFGTLGNPFYMPVCYKYTEKGKEHYLSGVDMDGDIYNPIYIECDEYCECVRVYERG